jgi:hypothetical protein
MMKYSTCLIACVAALAACSRTTTVRTAAGDIAPVVPANARMLPAGAVLHVDLDEKIGTKHSRVGDAFTATVDEPVIARNGETVVPKGARVHGRVTGLHAGDAGKQSVIRLDFNELHFGGRRYPFDANVVEVEVKASPSKKDLAKGALIGGAAGAVLGGIITGADATGIVTGGLLGAGAGTVISLGMGDVEATIPEDSDMKLRTTRNIALR